MIRKYINVAIKKSKEDSLLRAEIENIDNYTVSFNNYEKPVQKNYFI